MTALTLAAVPLIFSLALSCPLLYNHTTRCALLLFFSPPSSSALPVWRKERERRNRAKRVQFFSPPHLLFPSSLLVAEEKPKAVRALIEVSSSGGKGAAFPCPSVREQSEGQRGKNGKRNLPLGLKLSSVALSLSLSLSLPILLLCVREWHFKAAHVAIAVASPSAGVPPLSPVGK